MIKTTTLFSYKQRNLKSWSGRLLLFLMILYSSSTLGQISYYQDWESAGLGGWTTSGDANFSITTASPCYNTASVRTNVYLEEDWWFGGLYGNEESFLTSPVLGQADGSTPVPLSFDYKAINYNTPTAASAASFTIAIQWANNLTGPWNTIETIGNGNHTSSISCQTKSITFTPTAGNLYVRFKVNIVGENDIYAYIDNFSAGTLPTCFPPNNIEVSEITPYQADVSWTASEAPAISYDYEVRSSGEPGTSGAVIVGNTTETSMTLPADLDPVTTYYVYIKSICGTDDESAWSLPKSFLTLCIPLTPPTVTQTFDGYAGAAPATLPCWSEANGNFTNGLTGTTSSWTNQNWNNNYDATGGTNGTAAYINLYGSKSEWLISPQIDLGDGSTNYQLEYDVSITPYTGTATLTNMAEKFVKVVVSTDGGYTWEEANVIKTYDNNDIPNNQGRHEVLSLSGYTGIVKVAFYAHSTTSSPDTRFYIDNFKIEIENCPVRTNISHQIEGTDLAINWSPNGTSTLIEYGNSGFTLGEGTTISSATDSVTIENLTSNTTHQYYIQNVCEGGQNSPWSGPYSVFINPIPGTITYNEDFEGAVNDWLFANGTQPNKWFIGNAVANGAGLKSLYISNDSNGATHNYTLTSSSTTHAYRDVTIPEGTTHLNLSFDWRANGESSSSSKTDFLEVWFVPGSFTPSASSRITSGTNRIKVGEYNLQNTWQEVNDFILDVSTYTSTHGRIVFTWINNASAGEQEPVAIDNLSIVVTPCAQPLNLGASELTKHSAKLHWEGNGTQFDIVWGEADIIPDTGTLITNSNNNYILSGLTHSTIYQYFVRQNCSVSEEGVSVWSGPYTFTTLCEYPDITATTSQEVCGSGTSELTATSSEGILQWFTSPTGSIVHTGTTYTTSEIDETTSFYVRSGITVPTQDIKVGNGTSNSSSNATSPLHHNWGGLKTQYLFTATELIEAGLRAGPISSLGFEVVTASEVNRNDFTVHIGTTPQNTATNTHISGLSLVYSNNTQPMVLGLNKYTFTTPFIWDGTSNIVVQINWSNNNSGNHSNSGSVKYHTTSNTSKHTYTEADNRTAAQILATTTGSVANATSGGTYTSTNRANTYFDGIGICTSPLQEIVVEVISAPDLILSHEEVSICPDSESEMITIQEGIENYDSYVWEPSTGITGDAESGWVFSPETTTDYTLTAINTESNCKKYIEFNVHVQSTPTPLENNSFEICQEEIIELSLTGGLQGAEATIGTGASSSSPSITEAGLGPNPLQTYYGGSKQQWMYKAEELAEYGFVAGSTIKSLALELTVGNTLVQDVRIKMKNSLTEEFTTNSNWETEMIEVKSPADHTAVIGMNNFILDTPFLWDGVSSLIIEINYSNNTGSVDPNTSAKYDNTDFVSTLFYRVDNRTSTEVNNYSGAPNYRLSQRNNVVFNISNPGLYTWTPSDNLYTDEEATIPYISGEKVEKVYFKSNEVGTSTYTASICSANAEIEIEVSAIPEIITQEIVNCTAFATVDATIETDLTVDSIKWFATENSTEELDMINEGGIYYVEATRGICSGRKPIQVSIISGLPTVNTIQYFCDSATVADLTATATEGFTISWFETQSGPVEEEGLAENHVLTTGTYYVQDTGIGCNSLRIAVQVVITPTPPAPVASQTVICQSQTLGSTAIDVVSGAETIWYENTTTTIPLANSQTLTSGTYYISQKVNSCESERAEIVFTVLQLTTPSAEDQTFCANATVSQLVASGGLDGAIYLWYDNTTNSDPLTTETELTNGTYYVSQTLLGCESVKTPVQITIINTNAPQSGSFVFCHGAIVADLGTPEIPNAEFKWYQTANTTTPLSENSVLTSGQYYLERTESGCISQRGIFNVTINPIPSTITLDNQMICGIIPLSDVDLGTEGEATINWYNNMGDTEPLPDTYNAQTKTYYVTQIINGCESPKKAITLSVLNLELPSAQALQTFCGSGTVGNLNATGASDSTLRWYSSANSTEPLNTSQTLQNGTYYVSQLYNGCESNRRAVGVRVISLAGPVLDAIQICEGGLIGNVVLGQQTGVSYRWYTSAIGNEILPNDTELTNGTYYISRVQSGCESERGLIEVNVIPKPSTPTGEIVQVFEIEINTDATISDIVVNESGVIWYITPQDAANGVNALLSHMPLVSGTTYYGVLINSNGCISTPIAVKVETMLSDEKFDNTSLVYYPNPVTDILNVSYGHTIEKLTLYSLSGQTILEQEYSNTEVSIDLQSLSTGTYILQIQSGKQNHFVKIVKK